MRPAIQALTLLALAACGTDPAPVSVAVSVEIYPARAIITGVLGDTARLVAMVKDQNGDAMEGVSVSWSSRDLAVATVSAEGVVTAAGPGEGGVVAVVSDTVADTAAVLVSLPQRDILMMFHESLGGSGWVNDDGWGELVPLGTWHGIGTDEDGNVTSIHLEYNDMVGTIPPDIRGLTRLRKLNLAYNEGITGVIPREIAELEHLVALQLHHNALTGRLPVELADLTALDTLDVHHNQLEGPFPAWVSETENPTGLVFFRLWANDFTGAIPESIGNLTEMVFFDVQETLLSGPLPRGMMNLRRLDHFYWSGTDLCSPPDEAFQRWLNSVNHTRGMEPCDEGG